jgi:hypothetical protein
MNSKRLAGMLAAPALVASILAGALCLWYLYAARQNLVTQNEAGRVNLVITGVRALLGDCAEYAKHDKDMLALLQSMDPGAATNAARPAASTPAKPAANTK